MGQVDDARYPYRRASRRRPALLVGRALGWIAVLLLIGTLLSSRQCTRAVREPAQVETREPVFDLADVRPPEAGAGPRVPAGLQSSPVPAATSLGEPPAESPKAPAQPEDAASAVAEADEPASVQAAAAIKSAVASARKKAGLAPLDASPILHQAAARGAAAMVAAIRQNPESPRTPPELDLKGVKAAVPGAAQLSLEVLAASAADDLARKAGHTSTTTEAGLTHLGIGIAMGDLATGQPFYTAVLLGARILPGIAPELVNQGQREFFMQCHLCGAKYLVRLQKPPEADAGSLCAACPKCGRLIDLYGIDTSQRYHRPPWFLRGFRPKSVKSPLEAWLFVLTVCSYVEDRKQYGRDEVWQTAEETYRARHGDCEDTAILLADWLTASGYKARAVIGKEEGKGHAWVVIRDEGRDYVLETTGGPHTYRRVPPRSTVTTSYVPHAQFDRTGIWFRKSSAWTSDYHSQSQWSRGPWPLESASDHQPLDRR